MKFKKAQNIEELLTKTSEAENTLLVKKNKNLSRTLRRFIKLKRKIAQFEQN